MSQWLGPDSETKAIFVDESTCIGCRACVTWAAGTFEMVEDQNAGRARRTRQWNDDEETMQIAVEMCVPGGLHILGEAIAAGHPRVRHEGVQARGHRHHGASKERKHGQRAVRPEPFARAESILKWRREGKQFIDAAAKKAAERGGDVSRARRGAGGGDRIGVARAARRREGDGMADLRPGRGASGAPGFLTLRLRFRTLTLPTHLSLPSPGAARVSS